MRKNRTIAGAIAGVALAAGLLAGSQAATADPGAQQVDVMGTIRWVSPTQWAAVNDTGHQSVGISSVEVLPDRLRVHYTFTADKVVVMQVTPDEAFTSASVRCGASAGLTYTDVYCYMPGSSTPVDPSLLTKKWANIWLDGTFTFEGA